MAQLNEYAHTAQKHIHSMLIQTRVISVLLPRLSYKQGGCICALGKVDR